MTNYKRPDNLSGNYSKRDLSKSRWNWLMALLLLASPTLQATLSNGPDYIVWATAVGSDSTVYIGGAFNAWGPQTGGGASLAVADGSVNTAFPYINGQVNASVADGAGGFYIAGSFSQVGNYVRTNAAHLDVNGNVTAWNPHITGGGITALVISADFNTVYVGGQNLTMCLSPSTCNSGVQLRHQGLVAINSDGTLSSTFDSALATAIATGVSAMAISGNTLYFGGSFTSITSAQGTVTRNHIAAVNTITGALNTTWNPNVSSTVSALAVSTDGKTVYMGGAFNGTTAINGNLTRNYLAAVDATTATATSWNPTANNMVAALAISGSTVYIGGNFTSINISTTRNYLAAVDATLGTPTSWNPNAKASVSSLAISGSTVYIGGNFMGANAINSTTLRNGLAAVDATSGIVTSWNPSATQGNNTAATVSSLAISSTGSTVYAGGTMSVVNGTTRNELAAITPAGALTSWNPNVTPGTNVYALTVLGNSVYAGGNFTAVCVAPSTCTSQVSTARNRLVAINTDGTLNAWNPNANNNVWSLASSGSTIYAGGAFTTLCTATSSCGSAAVNRNHLAAISSAGTLNAWNPNVVTTAGNGVSALAISGTTVYAGGPFTTLCTTPSTCTSQVATVRNGVAAINSVDSLTSPGAITSFNPNVSGATALAVSGNTLYIGGGFTTICASPSSCGTTAVTRNRIAAISTDGTTLNSSFNPSLNGNVAGLAVSGNTVYVAGSLSTACASPSSCNGQVAAARQGLSAFGSDGSLQTWNPNLTAASIFTSLSITGNTLYAGANAVNFTLNSSQATSNSPVSYLGIYNTPVAPTVTTITGSADYGSIAGGKTVTITGTNFVSSALSVSIGGNAATNVTYVSSTSLTATTPAGTAGTASVLVTSAGGTNAANSLFTYYAAPTVSAMTGSADYGSISGGKTVTITGTNFVSGDLSVTIGGNAATNVTWVSSTSLTVTTPAGTAGTDSVLVTSAGGTNADNTLFTYDVAPVVSSISPTYGVTAGGTAVTLTGSSFTDATAVSIGGTAATHVTVVSATSITAITPAHAAGTANVLVTSPGGTNAANTLFKYTNCGPGVSLTTGTAGVGSLWQMLALPCIPTTSTIAGVFGDGTLSNLTTANYAVDQTNVAAASRNGWIIEDRTVLAVPAYEPLVSSATTLNMGVGYWLKSYQAPTNGLLSMDGTPIATDVTQAQGCYSANGCKAITVTTYKATYNRYNLVGNPFPYAVDWTKVRIRVDSSPTTYTPAQAAGVAVGDPLNLATPVISNVVNIWNATNTGYDVFTDVAPYPSTPNLQYFKSFWVNVLPGGFGHTVELLIPAEQSTLSLNSTVAPLSTGAVEQVAKLDLPWYLGWLDVVVSPAVAAPVPVAPTAPTAVSQHVKPQALSSANEWYIRLKVDNPVTGWNDHGSLLGELMDAKISFDKHDIPEMTPFTAPYLTLVFSHPEWGANAGDYASDFHSYTLKAQSWSFEVRAMPVGSKVFLSWEGSSALLKRSRLIEVATGKTILPSDPRWTVKGYPITLKTAVQAYTWQVLP